MRQGPPTPVSHASGSPRTPYGRSPGSAGDYFTSNSQDAPLPSPRQIKRPGGYGGFTEQDGNMAEPLPSPGRPGTGYMSRMDSVTPGPFEAVGRHSPANLPVPERRGTGDSYGRLEVDRPGTSHSNMSAGSGEIVPPRLPRKNGYGGFGPPSRHEDELHLQPFGSLNRAETFPRPATAHEAPLRSPSAPGTRPQQGRNSSNPKSPRVPSMGPDKSRRPPPRKSLIRPANKEGSIDLAAEFGVGNPYHTPSDSASSGYSSFSGPSYSSSQTSPARSHTRNKGSNASNNLDNLTDETQASLQNLRMKDPYQQLPAIPRSHSPLAEPPKLADPRDDRYDSTPTASSDAYASTRYGSSPQKDPGYFAHKREPSRNASRLNNPLPPAPAPFPTRQGSRETGALPYRGDCKACGLAIRGKSVSSADGRLTGRYHKPCFVCSTCSEPFASAEFYVLDDKPYCERHYHKLNGSLCGTCGHGIEGQYVEDESLAKHHVSCFCCLDCGCPLTDGYFEVDGKSYCEKDAYNRVQKAQAWGGGGGSYPPGPDPHTAPRRPPPSSSQGSRRGPAPPRPAPGMPGLPSRPSPGMGSQRGGQRPPYRSAVGMRPGPNIPAGRVGLAPPPPKLNKRSTRLGMM